MSIPKKTSGPTLAPCEVSELLWEKELGHFKGCFCLHGRRTHNGKDAPRRLAIGGQYSARHRDSCRQHPSASVHPQFEVSRCLIPFSDWVYHGFLSHTLNAILITKPCLSSSFFLFLASHALLLQLPTCILQIHSVGFSFDLLVFRSNNLGTQRTGTPEHPYGSVNSISIPALSVFSKI